MEVPTFQEILDMKQVIADLKSKLNKSQTLADNHRRSRDYHKETNAALRKELDILNDQIKYWHKEHDIISDAFLEKQGLANRLATILIVVASFSISMTVLFFWAVRR